MSGDDDDDDDDESVGTSGRTPPHRSFLSFFFFLFHRTRICQVEETTATLDGPLFGWPSTIERHRQRAPIFWTEREGERGMRVVARCSSPIICQSARLFVRFFSLYVMLACVHIVAERDREIFPSISESIFLFILFR